MADVERNESKCGTHGPRNSILRVLFGSGHLSSVRGHSVHFAKFPTLRFSKGYCFHSFHPSSTKPYRKSMYSRKLSAFTSSGYLPNFKSIWHFEEKLPQLYCQIIQYMHCPLIGASRPDGIPN